MADQKGKISWQELLLPETTYTRLRQKLRQQLEKDFDLSLAESNWAEPIMAALQALGQEGNLSQLLYRIDLAEGDYEEAMQAEEPWAALTLAVMKREALKVILRSQLAGEL